MTKAVKYLWRAFFLGAILFVLLIALTNFGILGKMPSLEELENPSSSLASEVIASDGTLMGKFYMEDRTNVEYKDISKNIIHALIAAEDQRFYDHSGIDGRALARVVYKLGQDGGGSTITQQLALNLFDERARGLFQRGLQKIKEWIIAVKLERNFTKEEIIALYLNTVEYSDNVFGIRNASKTFFQKEPALITVEEAALLIGMVNAPGAYNPRLYPAVAMKKRNNVMNDMVRNGFVTEGEVSVLKNKPIKLNYKKLDESTGLAPYFRDVLRDQMKKWCKEHKKLNGDNYNIYKDGLKIYTTINPRMQLYAEEAVAKHMSALQKNYWTLPWIKSGSIWKGHENILEKAMKESDRWKSMAAESVSEADMRKAFNTKVKMKVFAWNAKRETDTFMTPFDSIRYHKQIIHTGFMVMDPFTGEVKAWVGGVNFKSFKYDHVNINTKRQVGSTFKPILYAYAVENGFTPETPLPGGPINLGGKVITGSGGPMATCLAYSKNPGAAYLMKQFGVKSVITFANSTGIKTKLPPYPSIALGSADISVFEMLHSYTMFPTNGMSTQPVYISRIEDRNGNILQTFSPEQKIVLSEAAAYTMCKMMKGVVDFGTGKNLRGMGISGDAGGKTGTTNDNTDTWFIGYTPQLLAGAWVGCDDPFLKMVGEGNRTAMPIWGYFFQKVQADKTLGITKDAKFTQPESMKVETFMDYENFVEKYRHDPDAQNTDAGNGSAEEYGEIEMDPGQELGAESEFTKEEDKVTTPEVKKDPAATDSKKAEEKKPEDQKKDNQKDPAVLNSKDKKPVEPVKKPEEKKKTDPPKPKPSGN